MNLNNFFKRKEKKPGKVRCRGCGCVQENYPGWSHLNCERCGERIWTKEFSLFPMKLVISLALALLFIHPLIFGSVFIIEGTDFDTPSSTTYTYEAAMNFTADNISVSNSCVTIGGGDYEGEFCYYNLTIGSCLGGQRFPLMNISYVDATSDVPVNTTNAMTLTFADSYQTFSYNDSSTNYSRMVCMNQPPAILDYTATAKGQMQLSADNYLSKIFLFDVVSGYVVNNNPVSQFIIPMINVTESTTITFTWQTTTFSYIDGTMLIYECLEDGTENLVESLPVLNGEVSANLNLFYTFYRYALIYEGVTYEDSSFSQCHAETNTERTFYVDLGMDQTSDIISLYNAKCNLGRESDNVVALSWSADNIVQACLNAYRVTATGKTQVYHNCTSGPTGNIQRTIPDSGYNYIVEAYLNDSNLIAYCDEVVEFYDLATASTMTGNTGIYSGVALMISLVLVFMGNVFLMMLGLVVGIIAASSLSFLEVPLMVILSIIAFLGIISYIAWRVRQE